MLGFRLTPTTLGILRPPPLILPAAIIAAGAQVAWALRNSTGWVGTRPFKRPADGLPDGWSIIANRGISSTKDNAAPLDGYILDQGLFLRHSNLEVSNFYSPPMTGSNVFGAFNIRIGANGGSDTTNNIYIHNGEIDGGGSPTSPSVSSTLTEHGSNLGYGTKLEDLWIHGSSDDSIKLNSCGKIIRRVRAQIGAFSNDHSNGAHYDGISIDGQRNGSVADLIEDCLVDITPAVGGAYESYGRTSAMTIGGPGGSAAGGVVRRCILGLGADVLDNGYANGNYYGPRPCFYSVSSGVTGTDGWAFDNNVIEFGTSTFANSVGFVEWSNNRRLSTGGLIAGPAISAAAIHSTFAAFGLLGASTAA